MNKSVKMADSQQNVKTLDVTIRITSETSTNVDVKLINPQTREVVYSEIFKMLPNVPLESYVQYTFGMYNASICKNEGDNS